MGLIYISLIINNFLEPAKLPRRRLNESEPLVFVYLFDIGGATVRKS